MWRFDVENILLCVSYILSIIKLEIVYENTNKNINIHI